MLPQKNKETLQMIPQNAQPTPTPKTNTNTNTKQAALRIHLTKGSVPLVIYEMFPAQLQWNWWTALWVGIICPGSGRRGDHAVSMRTSWWECSVNGWIMAQTGEGKLFSSTLFGVSQCHCTAAVRMLLQANRNSLLSLAIDFPPAPKDAPEKIWTAFKINCQRSEGTWRTFYHDNTEENRADSLKRCLPQHAALWVFVSFNEAVSRRKLSPPWLRQVQ